MSGVSNGGDVPSTPSAPHDAPTWLGHCVCGHGPSSHEPIKTPMGDYTTACQACSCRDWQDAYVSLRLVPVSFAQANEFVAAWHRHNAPMPGAKFSVGVADMDGVLHGVAMVGRPVARAYDDGETLEVCRVATDGTKNASSMLYGACRRASWALGYRRLITYTLSTESGASLNASGWKCIAQRPSRPGWSAPSRPRDNTRYESVQRQLWEVVT